MSEIITGPRAVEPAQMDELETRSAPLGKDRQDRRITRANDAIVGAVIDQPANLRRPLRIARLQEAGMGVKKFTARVLVHH